MSETLGSLCDKIIIVKLKQFYSDDLVRLESLYSAYWHRSGTNQKMRYHLRGITEEAAALFGKTNARVLDIGCNDGTLLSYYPEDFEKYGVDPSDVAQENKGNVTVIPDIFPSDRFAQRNDQTNLEYLYSQKVDCDNKLVKLGIVI